MAGAAAKGCVCASAHPAPQRTLHIQRIFLGAAFAAALAASSANAGSVGSFDSFAVTSSGQVTPNILEGDFRNNVFRFDLTGIVGHIVSATLSILPTGTYTTGTAIDSVQYAIYEVTSDLAALGTTAARTAAFTDFGSGTFYGSTSIATPGFSGAMPAVTIVLNQAAVGDLNAALGGTFAIGGTSNLPAGNTFVWSSSNASEPVATLTYEVAPVPVPAALPMLLAALGGLGLLRCRAVRTA